MGILPFKSSMLRIKSNEYIGCYPRNLDATHGCRDLPNGDSRLPSSHLASFPCLRHPHIWRNNDLRGHPKSLHRRDGPSSRVTTECLGARHSCSCRTNPPKLRSNHIDGQLRLIDKLLLLLVYGPCPNHGLMSLCPGRVPLR